MTVICRPECFLPEARSLIVAATRLIIRGAAVAVLAWPPASPAQIALVIEDLEAAGFKAHAIRANLPLAARQELQVEIGTLTIRDRTWRNTRVRCPDFRLEQTLIGCADGVIDVGEKFPLSFTYFTRTKALDLVLKPTPSETWRLRARFAEPKAQFEISIDNGKLARLAPWLPSTAPKPSAGTIKGAITIAGTGKVTARVTVEGLAFSDASGLHAGEKIAADLHIEAEQRGAPWHWQAGASWSTGEVFWQPLYATSSGQKLSAEGVSDAMRTEIRSGRLELPAIGEIELGGVWDHAAGWFDSVDIRSSKLHVTPLYAQILQPFLEGTAAAALRTEGEITIAAQLRQGELRALDVGLNGVSLEDRNRRFALFGINGHVPWRQDAVTTADMLIKGGEVWQLPFGEIKLPLRMHRLRFDLPKLVIPVLDGALTVDDFMATSEADGWRWQFRGGIAPISVIQLAQAAGLPTMHGSLSGVIPMVSYARSTLTIDGALLIKIFDGTVVAKGVTLLDPFGKTPQLQANLDMKNLDLDLLTRTFSFGNITGRIDVQVSDMELAAWQPVKFDARIASSAGEYPRKISQTAVQNISSLGGAGAAGAIQRSFLRFFDEFGYEKLGLTCRLRNNVCEMGGVEDAPQGYVIVKGGGIPAISVIGYNRLVNWRELIERLKRIMQDNVHAIVK